MCSCTGHTSGMFVFGSIHICIITTVYNSSHDPVPDASYKVYQCQQTDTIDLKWGLLGFHLFYGQNSATRCAIFAIKCLPQKVPNIASDLIWQCEPGLNLSVRWDIQIASVELSEGLSLLSQMAISVSIFWIR